MARNPVIEAISEALRNHPNFTPLFKHRVLLGEVEASRRDPADGRGWVHVRYQNPQGGAMEQALDVPIAWPPGVIPAMPKPGDDVLLVLTDNATDPLYAVAFITPTHAKNRELPGESIPRLMGGLL